MTQQLYFLANFNKSFYFRVNPIFRETELEGNDHQDPAQNVGRVHHQAKIEGNKHGYYFPESYSSGYWSFNEGNVHIDPW